MIKTLLIFTAAVLTTVAVLYISGVIACLKMRYEDDLLD